MPNISKEEARELGGFGPISKDDARKEFGKSLFTKPSRLTSLIETAKTHGIGSAAWEALAIPEQMSREGLGSIAGAIPAPAEQSGSLTDIGLAIPKMAAETIAEAAPGFISRGSIVTAGGAKALTSAPARFVGRQVAAGLEGMSGIAYKNAGSLGKVFDDPAIFAEGMLGKGKKSAGALYDAAKTPGANSLDDILEHKKLVEFAKENLGAITPEEALAARKSLDAIKKTIPADSFVKLRADFDAIAKQKFAAADAAYARGVVADAVTQVLPTNKLGGASSAKVAGAYVLGSAGLAAGMSPAIQGAVAAALGTVGANPAAAATAYNAYQEYMKRKRIP